MIASGGATQSDLWMQLHADITGKPIVIPEEQQAVSLGSAIAGAVAAGMYGSLGEAAAAMVRFARTIEPDSAVTERYRIYVDQYEATYEALKGLSHELTATIE